MTVAPTEDQTYMSTYATPMSQVLSPLGQILPEMNRLISEANDAAKANNAGLQKQLLTQVKPHVMQVNTLVGGNMATLNAALAYSNERKSDPQWAEQAGIWENWIAYGNTAQKTMEMMSQMGI
jgi:hypothetical protein